MQERDIDRRTFVSGGVATGALALAGCFGTGSDAESDENPSAGNETDENDTDENESDAEGPDAGPAFPEIDDKPDAVYTPTHRESMRHLKPIAAGDYRLAPMLSYPHPFWTVAGSGDREDAVERVDRETMLGVHLMFTLWDAETGVVLPVDSGTNVSVSRNGDLVERQSMWSMISQEMGFHFGDNVPLDGDDTYAVEVEVPPLSDSDNDVRTTGDLEGRFTDGETATFEFEFEYDQAFRDEVYDPDYLDEERWGEPGALEPMARDDVPYSRLPEVDEFPGTLLVSDEQDEGETEGRPETMAELPRSGDAAILATGLESGHRLADGDGPYLLVSPRTPYNRVPLPNMRLSATVERDGETVTDGSVDLVGTIDGEYGIHYGASLEADALRPDDRVTLTVQSPPQIARHQGYDTAFLEMEPIELRVPEQP